MNLNESSHSFFSDIDLVIFGAWSELPLRTIERELLDRNIANPENLKVLDRAAVSEAKFKLQEIGFPSAIITPFSR